MLYELNDLLKCNQCINLLAVKWRKMSYTSEQTLVKPLSTSILLNL